MTIKDSPEWDLGQWGETQVRYWLEHDCGMFVVPTTCIETGGAPALTRLLQRYVLPDYQAFGNSPYRGWIEVKTKTRAVLWGKSNEFRHGVAARLWKAYRAVEIITRLPGHLAIVQLEPEKMLLIARMDELEVYPHAGSTEAHGEEMVFFRLDDFERITIAANGPEPPRINPKIVRPWEVGRTISGRQPTLSNGRHVS